MMWSEQQCTGRMHFCAKEKRIKWMNLHIKGAIKVAHREVKVSHFGGDHISFLIFLNVSEVPYGSAAGSKEVSILQLTVQVLDHQCDNAPSSSKVEKIVWILAFTLARPSALRVTSHSKGLITYRPPLKEAIGRWSAFLTWTSPLMAIV